ncbi:MAG: hypothetical protein ABW133_06470, partial [Polyangiaceae bacterium]
ATPVVTDTGLQRDAVRAVARAHVKLLEAKPAPGRHLLGGHYVPWGRLADFMEEITGRKIRRLPIPGSVMRASGVVADVVKQVWDFQFPLSGEGMRLMTQWIPVDASQGGDHDFAFRDPRETLGDTMRWLAAAGHLDEKRLGKLRS